MRSHERGILLLYMCTYISRIVRPSDSLPLSSEVNGNIADVENIVRSNLDARTGLSSSTTRSVQSKSRGTSATFINHLQLDDGFQFCNIKGACRLGDGTVLLPSWMVTHSDRISRCGFEKVRYDIETSGGILNVKGSAEISTKSDFREYDVIGNRAPPGERSLLAEHLTPSLLIMDILRRPAAYKNITTNNCISENSDPCPQWENESEIAAINPMIFVDSRVTHTKDFKWPKSLLRLMRNSMEGALEIADLKDIYGWKIRTQALCFRSISSTNVKTMDLPATAFLPDHVFFSANGLKRKPAELSRQVGSTCTIKVLILNRYGKRFMEGSDLLSSAISLYGSEISKRGHRILIEAEEVFFEHSSFHEQVSIMQETDVVVATHGEANSNFIFLRPKTHVFEVLPFGFSSTSYQNLSRAYGISYESVRSQPDTEVFSACVKHFNANKGQVREVYVQHWEKIAKEFTKRTIHSEGNIQSNFSAWEYDQSDLKMLRECTLFQRTSVDTRDLALKVVAAATAQCNLNISATSIGK